MRGLGDVIETMAECAAVKGQTDSAAEPAVEEVPEEEEWKAQAEAFKTQGS